VIGLWFLVGGILGAVHIATQQWTIRRLEGSSISGVLLLAGGGMLLRLALVAGLLLAALQQGTIAALAAFGGLVLSRWLLLVVVNRDDLYPAGIEPGEF
jgi:hypothetical protein